MSAFLAMGGYAVWVWSAYAVALSVLAAVGVHAALSARARRRELDALRARLSARAGRA